LKLQNKRKKKEKLLVMEMARVKIVHDWRVFGTKTKEDEKPLVLALSTPVGEPKAIHPSILLHSFQSNLSLSLSFSLSLSSNSLCYSNFWGVGSIFPRTISNP